MTQKKKTKFAHTSKHWVNVPIDALTDTRLEMFDRCLISYMKFRFQYFKDELKKDYFESTQTLADVFNVHRNTVSRAIQTLKSLGYLTVQAKSGSSNIYTDVNLQPTKVIDTPKPTQQVPVEIKKPKPKVVEDLGNPWGWGDIDELEDPF
jgi:predicted transcriptional regulator